MTGRIALLYIDRGNGWECLTAHDNDQAALESLSIDWGTDDLGEQPDTPIMKCTIRDRTGDLAGDVLYLMGARVWLQKTDAVPWGRFTPAGAWQDMPNVAWDELEDLDMPPIPREPDTGMETVFYGRVTEGGDVTQRHAKGDWLISLTMSGMSVLARRQSEQGPFFGLSELDGFHWPYDPVARLDLIRERLAAGGMPVIDGPRLDRFRRMLPTSMAPYQSDSYPYLSTILTSLVSGMPDMPLVYEAYETGRDNPAVYAPVPSGAYAAVVLTTIGRIAGEWDGHDVTPVPADQVLVDDTTLGLPDPVTRVVLKAKRVTWTEKGDNGEEGGRFGFEDAQAEMSDRDKVPANLTESRKSVTIDTDAVIRDDTAGRWTPGIWTPSETDRDRYAAWILANSTRLIPQGLTADSRHIDDDAYPGAFRIWADTPLVFIHNRYTVLTGRDGTPVTAGAWLPVAGTLTYRHHGRSATWRNELKMRALPRNPTVRPLMWDDLATMTCAWRRLDAFTWAEWAQIDEIKEAA